MKEIWLAIEDARYDVLYLRTIHLRKSTSIYTCTIISAMKNFTGPELFRPPTQNCGRNSCWILKWQFSDIVSERVTFVIQYRAQFCAFETVMYLERVKRALHVLYHVQYRITKGYLRSFGIAFSFLLEKC